jgi:hypothetical protein
MNELGRTSGGSRVCHMGPLHDFKNLRIRRFRLIVDGSVVEYRDKIVDSHGFDLVVTLALGFSQK